MPTKISLQGVTKQFTIRPTHDQPRAGVLTALDDVSLEIKTGESCHWSDRVDRASRPCSICSAG